MATQTEHRAQAEAWLTDVKESLDVLSDSNYDKPHYVKAQAGLALALQVAQVHATLATVGE